MQTNVHVIKSTYLAYDEDDYTAGGAVNISCDCGFDGFVDADDDSFHLTGNCSECDAFFQVTFS